MLVFLCSLSACRFVAWNV